MQTIEIETKGKEMKFFKKEVDINNDKIVNEQDPIPKKKKKSQNIPQACEAVDWLFELHSGSYTKDEVRYAAKKFGASYSGVDRLVAVRRKNRKVFEQVKSGNITLADAKRQVGYITYGIVDDFPTHRQYTRGDKFWEAIAPISTYLRRNQKTTGFVFSHLSPKEAERRLKKLEYIESLFAELKKDLAERAEITRLTVPYHKEKKNG